MDVYIQPYLVKDKITKMYNWCMKNDKQWSSFLDSNTWPYFNDIKEFGVPDPLIDDLVKNFTIKDFFADINGILN